MKFFIDTANVEEIRKANDMGIIAGVTTNPSLIAKEGRDYLETLREIASIVDGPISGEVRATTETAGDMVREGEEIFALDPGRMVVKIPMTVEGLKAIRPAFRQGHPHQLHPDLLRQPGAAGRPGRSRLCQSLSGEAGRHRPARHPAGGDHWGGLPELPGNPYGDHRRQHPEPHPRHGLRPGRGGHCHGPYKVLVQMTRHPLTDAGIEKFQADYRAVFGS